MSLLISNPVLDTIAATHADMVLLGRVLTVSNLATGSDKFIPIDYSKIEINPRPTILPSLTEVLQRQTFTFVAANDTTYGFTILQTQPNGTVIPTTIRVRSATTGATAATIATQLNAYIAGKALGQLKVTSSGASTVITVVALTGYPVFQMSAPVNGTVATAAANVVAFASSTAATPTVVTSTAHGLSTGMTVIPTGGTAGSTIKLLEGTKVRITVIDANSYSIDGSVSSGVADVAGGTVTLVPQASRGKAADLVAAGILGTSSSGTYAQCLYVFGQQETVDMGMARDKITAQRLWVNELATNYAALLAYWKEVNNAYNAGAVTTDPDTVAVGLVQ